MTATARPSPSRPMWLAWALALCGGLAVALAVVLALRDPCVRQGLCEPGSLAVARSLAVAGAATAVVGLLAGLWLLLHPRSRSSF